MDQSKSVSPHAQRSDQFEYLGRWVNKMHFRAFVYDKDGEQKLAENYDQFEYFIASGLWFASKPEVLIGSAVIRKAKNDNSRSNI